MAVVYGTFLRWHLDFGIHAMSLLEKNADEVEYLRKDAIDIQWLATMEHRSHSNGLQTFLEHWGFLVIAVVAFLASQVLMFFTRLTGAPWIWFFVASFALMFAGGGLIGYAKFPVYRSGRFFTFGLKSVPEHLMRHYRWGWRVFLFGVVLSLCLLLSRP